MSPKKKAAKGSTTGGFTDAEKEAMKARAKEAREEARGGKSRADGEREILTKIAELPEPDRSMARRLHEIIGAAAPVLAPKTWYGMPAWGLDGKVVCFFQSAGKFKTRYASFGFSDTARLDDGEMWPVAFAVNKLTAAVEARIRSLVQQAVQ